MSTPGLPDLWGMHDRGGGRVERDRHLKLWLSEIYIFIYVYSIICKLYSIIYISGGPCELYIIYILYVSMIYNIYTHYIYNCYILYII